MIVPRRIVLFGATGYTGRRTAEEMVARGLRPVLAGRDAGRLTALAQRLGGLSTAVADTGSVRDLVGAGDVLVSTVGPFLRLGEPALAAAADVGAIYLDSTGEPPFIRRVFEEFGPRAARSGASLLAAFGHDYVPGNLAGALALQLAGESGESAVRVEAAYYLTGVGRGQAFSRGTFASAAGVLGEPSFTWRDGIRAEPTGVRMRTFQVGGRQRPALSIGSSEHFALPRLAPGLREVDVYLGWFGPATRALHLSARLTPVLRRTRPLLRRVGSLLATRVAEEPDPAALERVTAHIIGVAYDLTGTPLAEVRLVTADPYRLTAALLAWGAARAAEHGVRGTGALGPVEAFGLDILDLAAAELGLRRAPP